MDFLAKDILIGLNFNNLPNINLRFVIMLI